MTKKMKSFTYEYWSKTEIGQAMIASDSVTDDDLLFLIPNNVKRMHGLPATRTCGKRKAIQKRLRKHFIMSFELFDMLSETIEKIIPDSWKEEYFGEFVVVSKIGDKSHENT